MALIIFYIIAAIVFSTGIIFLVKFYKNLRDSNSDLHTEWVSARPTFFVFMKYAIPVVIMGFSINVISSLTHIILILMNGQ